MIRLLSFGSAPLSILRILTSPRLSRNFSPPGPPIWRYYDLKEDRIIDNRYIIANLIACMKDTPRVVDPELFKMVFDLQERVIADILQSTEEQKALQSVPRAVDPIQQSVATTVQGYMDHPDIERSRAVDAIRSLSQPMTKTQVGELRRAFQEFQRKGDIKALLAQVEALRQEFAGTEVGGDTGKKEILRSYSREDLRLICMDFVTDG